ncbi:hypothetical protein PHLCEN_2v10965 [Hermanssonia centrifuga]|uniref:Uncharacterized protein n=1 Tax=Hermanssonia centrifuga TaxID=98765 RepID=A0A2R6NLF0_9APHY|nr:hypothetical protein PHLCEN_2v10965 [Hermanssonia centrifuga]
MPLSHQYLTRRSDNSVEIHYVLTSYRTLYTVPTLRTTCLFDKEICDGRIIPGETVIPGFYKAFASVFNSADDCRFKFALFEYATGVPIITGPPVPIAELVPHAVQPPPGLASVANDSESPSLSSRCQNLTQHLLWEAAEASARRARFIERKTLERIERKTFKTSRPAGGNSQSKKTPGVSNSPPSSASASCTKSIGTPSHPITSTAVTSNGSAPAGQRLYPTSSSAAITPGISSRSAVDLDFGLEDLENVMM